MRPPKSKKKKGKLTPGQILRKKKKEDVDKVKRDAIRVVVNLNISYNISIKVFYNEYAMRMLM